MERDVRIDMINSIMSTPHRNIAPLIPVHRQAEQHDPLFYAKMAVWYKVNGTIRDHNKLFACQTITSEYTEFRNIGQALLEHMPIREAKKTIDIAFEHFNGKKGGKFRRLRKSAQKIIRTAEYNTIRDDGVRFLRNAKVLRAMYVALHVAPGSDTIAASLRFATEAGATKLPAFTALQAIAQPDVTEMEICKAISKQKLPPMHVMGAVKEVTPAIAAALLESMSVPETLNYMAMFERKGLLDVPEFKKAVNAKIKKNKGKSKSASMRTKNAAKSLKKHSDVMETATDNFVDTLPAIKQRVMLAIDKSYSMQTAISLGKEVATILAAKVDNPAENLHVCVFDNTVKEIPITKNTKYSDFEAQFRYIRANGTTSLGAIIKYAEKNEVNPDVILMITDAEETALPMLSTALEQTESLAGVRIINCRVGHTSYAIDVDAGILHDKAIEIENVKYDGDYYSLPNLVKVISSGGIRELIATIDAIDISEYIGA